jgi:glycosyltransferase involved in cell wall biosynthesis
MTAKRGKRICIDARFYGTGSGLARYTRELLYHLGKLRSPHTFVVLLLEEDVAAFKRERLPFEVLATKIRHYTFGEQLALSRQLERAHLDLVHFTNFNYPIRYRKPFVVTLHDVTLLQYSGRSRLSRLKMHPMRLVVRKGIEHSEAVITISKYQQQLVARQFKTSRDRIKVIYEAVEGRYRPMTAAAKIAFRRRHGLDRPFLMYAGEWREHKNLVRLFRAFKKLRERRDVELVLVGKRDPAFPIIPETIKRLGLADDVRLTGFVDYEDLPKYYACADAFAFPSLTEGFGLPPLEAMASGTPVASSDAQPMPEILGDAALFFNPRNVADITKALDRVLTDRRLRASLRKKGLVQSKKYSWKTMARETLDVYESVLD